MIYAVSTDDIITRGPYVDVRAYASLNEAISVTSGKTILITNAQTLMASLTVPSDIALRVIKGGAIIKDSNYTLTINGSFEAGSYQTFSGFDPGDVTFGAGSVKEVLPQWWGAKGDGANDDRVALQSAVDSLAAGGVVYAPAGTYMLKSFSSGYYTVKPKSGVSVRGSGPATIFKFGNNLRTSTQGLSFLYDHDNPISNIIYSDFTVDWNGQNNLVSSSHTTVEEVNCMGGAAGVLNVHFRNLYMKNAAGWHHIFVSNLSGESNPNGNVTVKGCVFEDAGRAISGNTNATDHTSVFIDAPRSIVANNVFLMNKLNGTLTDTVATAMETHESDIVLEGNAVYGYAKGVNLGADYQDASGIIVQGNTFDNVITGISLWTASAYIASDWTIAKNDMRLREATGINSRGIEAQTAHMAGSNNGERLKIIGNRIRQLTQDNLSGYDDVGIMLYRWNKIAIENNEIINFVHEAIFVLSESGTRRIDGVNIKNNIMRGCGITSTSINKRFIGFTAYTTVGTDDITNIHIIGNQIIGEALSGTIADNGIEFNSGRFPTVLIENNDIRGVATNPVSKLATFTADQFMVFGAGPYDPWSLILASLGSRWVDTTSGKVSTAAYPTYDQQNVVWLAEYKDSAAPTSGTWHKGDRVWNAQPSVGLAKSWVVP